MSSGRSYYQEFVDFVATGNDAAASPVQTGTGNMDEPPQIDDGGSHGGCPEGPLHNCDARLLVGGGSCRGNLGPISRRRPGQKAIPQPGATSGRVTGGRASRRHYTRARPGAAGYLKLRPGAVRFEERGSGRGVCRIGSLVGPVPRFCAPGTGLRIAPPSAEVVTWTPPGWETEGEAGPPTCRGKRERTAARNRRGTPSIPTSGLVWDLYVPGPKGGSSPALGAQNGNFPALPVRPSPVYNKGVEHIWTGITLGGTAHRRECGSVPMVRANNEGPGWLLEAPGLQIVLVNRRAEERPVPQLPLGTLAGRRRDDEGAMQDQGGPDPRQVLDGRPKPVLGLPGQDGAVPCGMQGRQDGELPLSRTSAGQAGRGVSGTKRGAQDKSISNGVDGTRPDTRPASGLVQGRDGVLRPPSITWTARATQGSFSTSTSPTLSGGDSPRGAFEQPDTPMDLSSSGGYSSGSAGSASSSPPGSIAGRSTSEVDFQRLGDEAARLLAGIAIRDRIRTEILKQLGLGASRR